MKQIIDLALLTNGMLKGKSLTDFIQRSISLIEKYRAGFNEEGAAPQGAAPFYLPAGRKILVRK